MNNFSILELDINDLNNVSVENKISLPIEQSPVWNNFSSSCGHNLWKTLLIKNHDLPLALVTLYEYKTRGFKYLWAKNGPVYFNNGEKFEKDICLALRDFVYKINSKIVFLRLNIKDDYNFTRPVMRLIPYDSTVILDISGSDEDILSRMKPRGRRDVRKGLRESGMQCYEESSTILNNFDEIYEIMQETATRDGFVPHEAEFYKKMIEFLGDNCKFFVGRVEGKAVCWSITTVYEGLAVQYYAATSKQARAKNCYDHLVYFTCCYLRDLGVEKFDLMAIGSNFSPSLLGLNEFKTKFSKEIVSVFPSRDIICNSRIYLLMSTAFKVKRFISKLFNK